MSGIGDASVLAASLREGAAELGVALTPAQCQQLLHYLSLIAHWTRVYNLTAVRDPAQMLTQHLLDSLAVVGPLRRMAAGHSASLLDVGSGAGLPGIVIAVACPEISVTCVDAVGKKTGFIRQVGAELGLEHFAALHARVEEVAGRWDVVASRAFSSLGDFARKTRPVLAPGGLWMAMKGRVPDDEMAGLPADTAAFHVEPLRVPGLDAERCIVWMRSDLTAA